MFCKNCGKEFMDAKFCPACGTPVVNNQGSPNQYQQPNVVVNNINYQMDNVSPHDKVVAAVLCFFLGVLGVHRFYVGKIGTGILWLLTVGMFGIGALIDFIMILVGSFRDSYGRLLK